MMVSQNVKMVFVISCFTFFAATGIELTINFMAASGIESKRISNESHLVYWLSKSACSALTSTCVHYQTRPSSFAFASHQKS